MIAVVGGVFVTAAVIFCLFWFRMNGKARNGKELFKSSWKIAEQMYGEDKGTARVSSYGNERILVYLCYADDGEEAYYTIYRADPKAREADLWNGPVKRGKMRRGDEMKAIVQKVENAPDQWVYLFFNEGEEKQMRMRDNGKDRTVYVKPNVPMAVVTQTAPEEIRFAEES